MFFFQIISPAHSHLWGWGGGEGGRVGYYCFTPTVTIRYKLFMIKTMVCSKAWKTDKLEVEIDAIHWTCYVIDAENMLWDILLSFSMLIKVNGYIFSAGYLNKKRRKMFWWKNIIEYQQIISPLKYYYVATYKTLHRWFVYGNEAAIIQLWLLKSFMEHGWIVLGPLIKYQIKLIERYYLWDVKPIEVHV